VAESGGLLRRCLPLSAFVFFGANPRNRKTLQAPASWLALAGRGDRFGDRVPPKEPLRYIFGRSTPGTGDVDWAELRCPSRLELPAVA